MSRSALKALRSVLNGVPVKRNPNKHPVLSGAVPVVKYVPASWRYGNRMSANTATGWTRI